MPPIEDKIISGMFKRLDVKGWAEWEEYFLRVIVPACLYWNFTLPPKPVATMFVSVYDVSTGPHPELIEVDELWTKNSERNERNLQDKLKAWHAIVLAVVKEHALMFAQMQQCLADPVVVKLQAHSARYQAQIKKKNPYEFYLFIKSVLAEFGTDSAEESLRKLLLIEWNPRVHDLEEFIVYFQKECAECVRAGNTMSDKTVSRRLYKALKPVASIKDALHKWSATLETSKKWPKTEKLVNHIRDWETNNPLQSLKPASGDKPKPAPVENSKKRKYQGISREQELKNSEDQPAVEKMLALLANFLQYHESGGGKKQKRQALSATITPSKEYVCWRCGLPHARGACTIDYNDVQCGSCGRSHLTKFHQQAVDAFNNKHASSRDNKSGGSNSGGASSQQQNSKKNKKVRFGKQNSSALVVSEVKCLSAAEGAARHSQFAAGNHLSAGASSLRSSSSSSRAYMIRVECTTQQADVGAGCLDSVSDVSSSGVVVESSSAYWAAPDETIACTPPRSDASDKALLQQCQMEKLSLSILVENLHVEQDRQASVFRREAARQALLQAQTEANYREATAQLQKQKEKLKVCALKLKQAEDKIAEQDAVIRTNRESFNAQCAGRKKQRTAAELEQSREQSKRQKERNALIKANKVAVPNLERVLADTAAELQQYTQPTPAPAEAAPAATSVSALVTMVIALVIHVVGKFASLMASNVPQSDWTIIDTGAGQTVEQRLEPVAEFVGPTDGSVAMFAGDGGELGVSHIGGCVGRGKMVVCSNVTANLGSVPQYCGQGWEVHFNNKRCVLTHPDRSQPIIAPMRGDQWKLTREQVNDLGKFDRGVNQNIPPLPQARVNAFGVSDGLTAADKERALQVKNFHNSTGHPSNKALIQLCSINDFLPGTHLTASDVRNYIKLHGVCSSCVAAKAHKPSYHESKNAPPTRVGEIVYMDIFFMDKLKEEKVYGGYDCMLLSIDAFSKYLVIVPLISQHAKHLKKSMEEIVGVYMSYGHTISEIHSDSQSNFRHLRTELGLMHILLKLSPPYQHSQMVERYTNTIKQRQIATKEASPTVIPAIVAGELAKACVSYINDTTNSNDPNSTPRILFQGAVRAAQHTNARFYAPFGTVVLAKKTEAAGAKAQTATLLGPTALTYGATECFIMDTGTVVSRAKIDIVVCTEIPRNCNWKFKENAVNAIPSMKDPEPDKIRSVTTDSDPETSTDAAPMPTDDGTADIVAESPREGDIGCNSSGDSSDSDCSEEPASTSTSTSTKCDTSQKRSSAERNAQHKRKRTEKRAAENAERDTPTEQEEVNTIAPTPKIGRRDAPATMNNVKRVKLLEQQSERAAQTKKAVRPLVDRYLTEEEIEEREEQRRKNRELIMSLPMGRGERRRLYKWNRSTHTREALICLALRISVKSALTGEHKQEALEAINDEIQNMLNYKVGHYVRFRDIPYNKRGNILQSFMFLKDKTTPDGRYERTKARFVGNGANQKDHMYELVSSSTVALSSVFLLFNLATYYKCRLATYDIKGAFLHAEFGEGDEITYIKVNKEMTGLWITQDPAAAEFVDERGELILELDKFIYGLKQSPLKFQKHLMNVLKQLGYKQTDNDECLLVKHVGESFSILSTHVDDILQVSNSKELYDELAQGLIAAYGQITTAEKASAYLGMSIDRSDCMSYIKLKQTGLIDKLVEKYPRAASGDNKLYHSPAHPDLFKSAAVDQQQLGDGERSEYLGLIMTMMYLARLTRPDILLAVTFLSTRTHCVTQLDVDHALHVVRYLEGTPDVGIVIHCEELKIHVLCDASYMVHVDQKGHTGFAVMLGKTVSESEPNKPLSYVHGRSGKQKTASTSSTDAEIIAMVDGLKFAVWLRNLMAELQLIPLQEILIMQDNKSAICMGTGESANKRSKHILSKVTYVKDWVTSGAVRIQYLETTLMTADVLTKPMQGESFYFHVGTMMGMRWNSEFDN